VKKAHLVGHEQQREQRHEEREQQLKAHGLSAVV
jgi:hypothetical protein